MILQNQVQRLLLFCVIFVPLAAAQAGAATQKLNDSLVDPHVLALGDPKFGQAKYGPVINGVTGQQEAILSHEGFQYVTYYDSERHVCIARRALPKGAWQVIRLKDYQFKSNDGHNFISMGICPGDGTIHLAFDHHANQLHYRVSKSDAAKNPKQTKWDASLFGPVRSELETKPIGGLTYPRFLATPDGKLQLFYRLGGSGGGDMWMDDYDPATGKWSNHHQIDSGKGPYKENGFSDNDRCSYPNAYTYDAKGRLHVTWVWRETSGASTNHDLMYSYSDDQGKTWFSDTDEKLTALVSIKTPGITVAKIPMSNGLSNQTCQAVDSQGRVHVIVRYDTAAAAGEDQPEQKDKKKGPQPTAYFHYWRKGPGQWEVTQLPGGGGTRPKLLVDARDNVWMVTQKRSDLVIMAAPADTQWKNWEVIHTEKGPFLNEMLVDPVLWKSEGVLSIFAHERPPEGKHDAELRIIDFRFR